jgi:5-methylthioadenosine/S-adenosylhomocysteine deaminase
MNQVDTILNCRWLIPVEPEVVHHHYAVIINEGKIQDFLPQDQVSHNYTSKHEVNLDHHALLPGFVNAHTHSPMTLFRGLADDLPLMEWLNDHIWPAENKWLSREFIKEGTQLAIAEMIKSGTTCFNEHFFFPEEIANVVLDAKIRACIGGTIINFPTNWSKDENDAFNRATALYREYGNQALLTWSLAPHAPYTTTDSILRKIAEFSKEHRLPIHMHVHETLSEVQESLEKYSQRPLQRLHRLGLLSAHLQCVHMTQLHEADIELLRQSNSHVIHCPESNLKLASGNCQTQRLIQNNINVALGTDSAASNNDLDMMGEMHTAALIGKTVSANPTAVSATTTIRMATLNGAKALGLEDKIGSIEIGKSADIIAINLKSLNTVPTYHPLSQIIYSASNRQVSDVWIAGRQLLKDGTLVHVDEEGLFANIKKWQARIGR